LPATPGNRLRPIDLGTVYSAPSGGCMRVNGWGVPTTWIWIFYIVFGLANATAAQTTVLLTVADTQVVDTTIRNGSYATMNHDGSVLVTRSSTDPEWERRTLLAFDTTAIPANTPITSAVLTLTVKSGLGTSGSARPVAAYHLATSFIEGQASWRYRQSGVAWQTPGGDLAAVVANASVTNLAGRIVSFDVRALVQRVVNGEFGMRQARLALIDTGGGGNAKESYREYHSTEASTAANRPRLTITYGSATSGSTIDVPAGGSLQAAIDQAARGATIRLTAGATYTGNFTLPAKSGSSYITITTRGATLPPAGTRIDPSYRSRLAIIRSPNGSAALRTSPAASYYRIVGVEFSANVNGTGDVIVLGHDSQTSLSEVPHHIELDRILITGDPAIGQKRGISANAAHVSILNSDIRDIKASWQESQAIAAWNTPGPITIRNNLLESAGENILFGGAHINIPNTIPSDIIVEDNLMTKDPKWRGRSWIVKNIFELKNARRVRVRRNIMEYSWAAAQTGFAIVLTPRNSSGRTPWVVVEDVEFSGNLIRHSASVFNILGHDDTARSGQLRRLLIKNNLAYDIHDGTWGGTGRFVQIGGEPRDITIDHNTILHTGNLVMLYSGSYINSSGVRVVGGPIHGFVFTNNMAKHNDYGIFGNSVGSGTAGLNYYTPGSIVRRNVLATDRSMASRYPPDNFFPTLTAFNAGFVNPSARDYRLVSASPYVNGGTDGLDIGCTFD
jgi:hypothetical protein